MKHTIYAAKDLTIDSKPVKKLEVLAVVETEHDVRKVVASLGNGAGTLDGAKPADTADSTAMSLKLQPETQTAVKALAMKQ